MKIFRILLLGFLALFLFGAFKNAGNSYVTAGNADTTKWSKYISLATYLKPFWATDTITDETVQVIKGNDSTSALLLYSVKKILSVKAADFSREYIQGKDWYLKNGKLIIPDSSVIPFFRKNELVFDRELPGNSMHSKVLGTYVLFNEGHYFSSKQIAVTYIREKKQKWCGPSPVFAVNTLPATIAKLKQKKEVKIAFYGNSIEVGYNASGFEQVPPFMPIWPELVVHNLKKNYSSPVSFINKSVAGKLAQWGRDSVERVITEKPDLIIIGFGMNDGTARVAPGTYRSQIKDIIDVVRTQNKDAEFILIAPMLANPESNFDGYQAFYKKELDKLAQKGVVVADITGVHQELLKHKHYQDMTGNNINHPNDYLARWYAQFISGILIKQN